MRCVQWRRDYSGMDLENVLVMRRSRPVARRDKVPALPQWNDWRMVLRQMHDVRGNRDNLGLATTMGRLDSGTLKKGGERRGCRPTTLASTLPVLTDHDTSHACKAVWCASTTYNHMPDSAHRQPGT